MPGHLTVRGMVCVVMPWRHRRAGLRWRRRSRRGRCHRRGSCSRASWACAVWRKPWPAGVGTRQTHRVSARRACRLRPNGCREGQRGNHRHASQEMVHVQILFVGILDHLADSLARSPLWIDLGLLPGSLDWGTGADKIKGSCRVLITSRISKSWLRGRRRAHRTASSAELSDGRKQGIVQH
jgi:hypothetical protein